MDKFIGQKFNYLTVESFDRSDANGNKYYFCRCVCGKFKSVRASKLRSGEIKSCGCKQREGRLVDLTGKTFGKLTVLYQNGRDNNNNAIWHCVCECGNAIDVDGHRLTRKSQNKTSCGKCEKPKYTPKYENLVGNVYGSLKVLELHHIDKGAYWLCECLECGNKCVISAKSLKSNHAKSCGCLKVKHMRDLGLNYHASPKVPHKELSGEKFGKLTVLNYVGDGRWRCKCDCGNESVVDTYSLTHNKVLSCGNHSTTSKGEQEIKDFLFNMTKLPFNKDRSILDGKEIDLYNDELMVGIEYNGSMYHASLNGIYDNKPRLYHRDKFLLAKSKGVHLISIFDVDWINNKEMIKLYLKDKFLNKVKIFARKCNVVRIERYLSDSFCDKYHLQGHSHMATINYGLYYNNELMSVMCFGNIRNKNKSVGCYELHRYCVKSGYTIIGGANRLLKAFEDEFNPLSLLSYSDNDYFIGDIYDKLGFTYNGQVNPRYYWYYGNNEIKREKCQLKYLAIEYPELYSKSLNESNKEDFIMTSLNASKVYRSGNTKWLKVYKSSPSF